MWSSAPVFPTAPAWGPDPAIPASAGAWTPVIVRSVHGMELAVATDDGLIRLGVLTARDVATARDAGVTVLPGLIGAEAAIAADWGILTAQAVGRELAAARDAGTLGGWWRTETATAEDAGLTIPGAMTGHELAVAEDTGHLVAAGRGAELGAAADAGQGTFTTGTTAAAGSLTETGRIEIHPWWRYVSVILLGGGGGGAGGRQSIPAQDGYGGQAGTYAVYTWDRGASRNLWTSLWIEIGGGGGGGSRNNNGPGGTGGATKLWIDDPAGWVGEYLEAAGGDGGSGSGFGIGSGRDGKAPGNRTHDGITATGGGTNGGTPGGGGRGGGGASWPLNAGSGDSGARGQAWFRLSM